MRAVPRTTASAGYRRPARAAGVALLLALALLFPARAWADAWGVEAVLLAIHLRKETYRLGEQYPRKLDDKGRTVLVPGIEVNHDTELAGRPLGARYLRVGGAYYRDSMDYPAGFVGAAPRWELYRGESLTVAMDFGFGLFFRRSWRDVPGYGKDDFYEEAHGYEYKWTVMGEVDLLYDLGPDRQAVWSIVPAVPYVVLHAVGLRWAY